MTHLSTWVSIDMLRPDIMRTLGWSLVHFLWQGAAIAALLAAAMAMCHSTATRYVLAVGALTLMLASPVVTFSVLWHGRENAAQSFAPGISLSSLPEIISLSQVASSTAGTAAIPSPAPRVDVLLWFVELWFAGVVILSLRTAGGVLWIERMRRRDAKPVSAKLHELCVSVQQRLGISRAIRYCESTLLDAPAVLGWFRPAILLPLTAITGLSGEQLQAVIAHELAHIRRFDNIVNLFQVLVETLLFYHPAVWWVSKRIRSERENCCDDAAISVCNDAIAYARALARMAESRTAPGLAMAANRGPLAERVARLIGVGRTRSEFRSAGIAASCLCLAGAVFAANGFVGAAHSAFAPGAPAHMNNFARPGNAAGLREPATLPSHISVPRLATSQTQARAESLVHSAIHAMVSEMATVATRVVYSEPDQEQTQSSAAATTQPAKSSYIEGMKAAGFDNLTADELIALKVQGVTPDYVRAIHDLGLKPTVDELISLRVQGITPEYIKEMRAAGFTVSTDTIIGMKVQGITPEYVKGMHDMGIDTKDADELIGLKVQGVTPDYINRMRAAGVGLKNVDTIIGMKVQGITPDYVDQMKQLGIDPKSDELIGLKVQGVTPEYIKQMRAAGLDVTADRAIGMKVQGVTPEYVKEMHELGIKPDADELVGMRVQGVTPEYIKQMRAAGLKASSDQLVGMKVQGVTPEYVKALRATGLPDFKDDPDCYIGAKVQGITPEFIAAAQKHGFKDLDLDKLIQLKNSGVLE